MAIPDEKDLERPVSPTSAANNNSNKPLPELQKLQFPSGQRLPTTVPKRKPVPIKNDADAFAPDDAKNLPIANIREIQISPSLDWRRFLRRKRLLVVGGVVAAVILIALVIGLSVGLTRGNGHQNLPLPTSHGRPYEGDLTYYDPELGSCGITSSGSDMICAVSHVLFDAASSGSNPNENPLCGLKIRVKRGGSSVDVQIVDRCVGCKATDLDVSRSVFKQLADIDQGRVPMEWSWLENSPVDV